MNSRLASGDSGRQMLDAPVSGSVPQVQAGTLTIMVGGDEDAYGRVEPVLRVLGFADAHRRATGRGSCSSSRSNDSLAVQMIAFAEGLLLAEKGGGSILTWRPR